MESGRVTASPDELARRKELSQEYYANQEVAKIDDEIRCIRISINTLIRLERELLKKREGFV